MLNTNNSKHCAKLSNLPMYCVKCPVLQQMVMTKKSTMLIKIMEMIMLIMVNKPYKFKRWRHIGSLVHPNLVMVASTFHVGIDLCNKIK